MPEAAGARSRSAYEAQLVAVKITPFCSSENHMTVTIKTPDEIENARSRRLAADVLEMIGEHVKPGVTTEALDRICHDYIVNVQQAIPAPLNYHKAFPSRSAPRSTTWFLPRHPR